MKKTDAHPGRPFVDLTAAGMSAIVHQDVDRATNENSVVWDWDERTSRGARRRPAMHLVGLRLDPGDFEPSTNIGADFDEEGNAEGTYFADHWDVSSAAMILDGIGDQAAEVRLMIVLWNDTTAHVGVLEGGEDYTSMSSIEWFDGGDWSEARADAMPAVIHQHESRSGVTIVMLDTPVPPDYDTGRDTAGLGGLRRALDDLLYRTPVEVTVRDFPGGAAPGPGEEFARVRGVLDRLMLAAETHGSVNLGSSDREPFDWFLLRENLRSPIGNLLGVEGVRVVQVSTAGDETWEEMRGYGIEGGFDRVVIVTHKYSFLGSLNGRRGELFAANLPEPLAEHNRNMTGAVRSVGAQALDTRLQDLHEVWAVLASWEGPVRDDAETAEFVNAYTVPGSDWPTRQQKSSPTIVWVGEIAGNRPKGYLEGLAAAYFPDRDLLEINAEFPVFAALHAYWTRLYQGAAGLDADWKDLSEIDYVVSEVVQEWCEQTLVEVVVGVNQLAGRPGWDEKRIKAALSPEALSGAAMAIHHVQQSIKRSLGQRLGSLKETRMA